MSRDEMADTLRCAYAKECEKRHSQFVDDSATKAAIALVAKWLTDPDKKGSLLLYGGAGNGKTTMLRAINSAVTSLRRQAENIASEAYYHTVSLTVDERKAVQGVIDDLKNVSIFFTTATDIVRSNATDMEKFKIWADCGLLLLDDLGRESLAVRHYGTELFPIIDLLCHRYDLMLPTIATSNLTDRELAETYGERVADRIAEYFDKVAYTNKSYRR